MMECPYDPRKIPPGTPIGMFHCPLCGEMVLAGVEHPRDDDIVEVDSDEALRNDPDLW